MKKKSRREPIVLPSSVEAAAGAKANRGQAIAKKATIGFASVVGAAALYYCLIPALAQDGGTEELYVFFDNGLSQYEGLTDDGTVVYGEVYESEADEEADKLTMMRLSDVETSNTNLWNAVSSQLGGNFDNINTDNVYVSTEPVTVGNYVSFTGYDSGTVYDTVTNYRINSASREWGYDYVDFQWTSDPTVLTEASTCYYAPPQMMMNRYGAEAATEKGGTKTMVQLIYEHGDSKGDSSSKPEVTGSWVNPQNAEGRTFYDAVFIMKGMFGDVHGINELGYESQSYYTEDGNGNIGYETLEGSVALNGDGDNGLGTAKLQYPAKATFFDYFSDWELAGNPIEDHEISYTYNNADGNDVKDIWEMSVDYTATAPITANFPEGDLGGFEKVSGSGDLYVRTDAGDKGHTTGDGTYFLAMNGDTAVKYTLPEDATGSYYSASAWVRNATDNTQSVTLSLCYQLNGAEQTVVMDEISIVGWNVDNGVWTELSTGSFYLPEDATDAYLLYTSPSNLWLDDFTLKYEGSSSTTVTKTIDVAEGFAAGGDTGGFELVTHTGSNSSIYLVNGAGEGSIGDGVDNGLITGDSQLCIGYGATIAYPIADAVSGNCNFDFYVTPSKYGLSYITVSVHYTLNGTDAASYYTYTLDGVTEGGGNEQIKNSNITESPVWHHVNGSLAIPEGATDVELWIQPYKNSGEAYSQDTHGTATYYLDDFSLSVTETIVSADFASGDPAAYNFEWIDIPDCTDDNKGNLSVTNGTLYAFWHGPACYTLPSENLKAGNYKFSMNVTDTKYELRNVVVYLSTDGGTTGTRIASLAYGKDASTDAPSGKWQTISGEFTVPEGATSVQLYFQTFDTWYTNYNTGGGKDAFGTDSAYYDNFKLEYETLATITESNECEITSSVKTAYDLIDDYTDEQKTAAGYSTARDYADFVGVTLENESTVVEDSIAKIYLKATADDGKVPLQGDNTYSNKETYIINGRVYSTDKVRVIARHFKSQTSQDVQVGEDQVLGIYEPGAISISENFNPPIGAGSTLIFVEPVDDEGNVLEDAKVLIDYLKIGLDLIDIEGSFAEGTNTIAYSYQGSLFNDAISTYYDNAGADPKATVPLYFGSNSWMTGNMRYYHYESRTPQFLFNLSEIADALANVGCETSLTRDDYINTSYTDEEGNTTTIWADGKKGQEGYDNKGAYIIPASREYWRNLFGYRYNTYAELTSGATEQELMGYFRNNTAIGFSNSRAVENLVWDQLAESNGEKILGLDGTAIESPYFNEAFLRGDNEANAAYGTVYNNVDFSFAFNEDTGYYEYDSTRAWHATRLTEKTGGGYYMDYYNYDQLVDHTDDGLVYADDEAMQYLGVKKADTSYKDGNGSSQTVYQFYPFNSPDTNDRFATENLMFGMKLDIPFNMYSDEEKRNNSMFKFSGDDDVWVYVDGNQVLDIGGTHTAVGGFIDLKNGYGIVGSSYSDQTGEYKVDMTFKDEHWGVADWFHSTGKDTGITTVQKAAFALLASLEEIGLDPTTVKNLDTNAKTGFTSWNYTDGVSFFDDKFVVASSAVKNKQGEDAIQFQYQIRDDDDNLVIDVKFRNAVQSGKDLSKIKVVTKDMCTSHTAIDGDSVSITSPDSSITYTNPYGLANDTDCYVVTQADWEAAQTAYGVKNLNNADDKKYKEFLNSNFCHPVGTILPQEYLVYGDTGMTDHLGYPTVNGNVTFELNQFELAESTEELSDHTLSVYYMERGLNSSNFKLAFNFVPNAQKQVEKLWADGNEAHEDCSLEQDYVDVELWRTEPQRTTLTDADVSIPEGYSLVRAVSHNSKTDTGTANSTFISDSSQVTVQYELQDAAIANSAVTLSLNSMPISFEAYKQLYSSLGMRIYINDNLVPITDEDTSTIADYEFFKPEAEYETAYPTDGVGTAVSKITDEQRMTAIKIPASDSKSNTIVKIVFKQNDAAAGNAGDTYTQYNTWGMYNCNAWLVDAYAFNADADDADTSTDPSIGIASGSVFGTGITESVTSKTSGYTLNADEMQFAISRAVYYRRGKDDSGANLTDDAYRQYMSTYIATAIMPEDALKLTYTYSGNRNLTIWSCEWTDLFTAISYEKDETYNSTEIDCTNGKDYTVKSTGSGNANEVLMVCVGAKEALSSAVGNNITYTATNTFDTIVYSNPYKVNGSSIRLDSSVDWTHLWDNVAESVTLGDETLDYKYFIREIAASSEHGTELSDYQTLYYDAKENGNLIQPTVVTDSETGEEMTLYSIDDTGYVQIVNNPITSAQIKKEWAVKDDSDMINIVVTLYGEDSKAAGAVTVVDEYLLSADNNYTVDLSSLPMYNPETGGKWKYYAAESISAKYTASYSTEGIEKTISGTTDKITVYPLAEAEAEGEPLTLTVTNQVEGFVLEINKVDEEGTTALEGAEFVLYEQNTDGSWAIVTKSATEEESEETETASVDSDSDSDAVAAASMNVVGNSYTGNSSVSNFGAQQVLGDAATITSDVYYNAGVEYDANPYASYFTFDSTPGSGSYNSKHGTAEYTSYNGTPYTIERAIKMGGSRTISFTVDKAFVMTLVISAKYAPTDTEKYDVSIIDSNDNKVSTNYLTSIDPNNTLTYLLPAGTYTIDRDDGESTLYFIDIHPVETPTAVSAGEYYNFSASSNDYSSRFDIKGNTNLTDISINYIDDEVYNLTKAMTMARTNTITFTTTSAMYLTIVSPPNVDDNDKLLVLGTDSSGKQILSQTLDDLHYDRTTTEKPSGWEHGTDVFSSEVISLPSAGTYSITCTSGSPYVSYLDFSTYNKYDAENFMKALKVDGWFDTAESVTLANELVNLQITQSGAKYDGTNAFNWGLMLDRNVGNGGWQKDPDGSQSGHWYHATIDNNVTTSHINYLAKAYQATKNEQYKKSVIAGIYCLINSQYSNGGWGSVFENVSANRDDCPHDSYHCRITYNDGAMTHVMEMLLDVRDAITDTTSVLNGIVDQTMADAAAQSVVKGVDCILNTQITIDGVKTAWCQQHYETDYSNGRVEYEPANARAHELASICASESVGIIEFLQKIEADEKIDETTRANVSTAIDAAIAWLDSVKITGYTLEDNRIPTKTADGSGVIWARFYSYQTMPVASGTASPLSNVAAVYDANNSSVTIQPNTPFVVNRVDKDDETETEYGKPISITADENGKAASDWLTVYTDISGMHDKNARNYAWYGTWGTGLISTDSGDSGEETPTYSVITEDTSHNFTSQGLESSYFNITLKEGSSVVTAKDEYILSEELSKYIKMEGDTSIVFTTEGESTLRLVVKYRAAETTTDSEGNTTSKYGRGKIKIDGVAYDVDDTTAANGNLLEIPLSAGEHTISYGESQIYLYNIEVDYADSDDSGDSDDTGDSETTIPSNAMIYITNSNGRVNIGGLQPGTYKLVETKAPLGYVALVDEIVFTVGATEDEAIDTSTITYTPNDGTNVTMAWATDKKLTLVATVRNKFYAITMPNTGARGVYPVFIGSALFAAAAFAGGMMRRRNKKR